MGGRALGLIPARGQSQRLPGKNTRLVAGKPLITWTIEAALQATRLAEVVVSTDDEAIAALAAGHGARVLRRPPELAWVDSPIDDAMRHAWALTTSADAPVDVVVCMQANVPVRKRGEIDEVVDRLRATPWATAVASAQPIRQRPEWMKRLRDPRALEIEPFMDAGEAFRTQDLPELYLLDGAIVAVRAEVLQKTAGDRRVHAYMGERVVILPHEPKYAVEIDSAPDLDLAEFFLTREGGNS